MIATERDDVPIPVAVAIFLHMGPDFWLLDAAFFWTVSGKCLAAEIFPMVKPTPAAAGIVARAVDVRYLHIVLNYL